MNTENNNNSNDKHVLPSGVRIAIAIGTLASVLIAFNQCTVTKAGKNSRSTASSASTDTKTSTGDVPTAPTDDASDIENDAELPDGLVMPPINNPTAESELDQVDVGVKNFEQIYLSMAALTGVSPSETTVQNLYKQLSVQLPADNNVKSFLPANQVAITKLAAEFCEKLVETQALRVVVWPTIDMTRTPTQLASTTPTYKQIIITQAIAQFLPPLDPTTQVLTVNELVKLFDDLLNGENLGSNVTTRKVVKGMCISTLASAHSTLL